MATFRIYGGLQYKTQAEGDACAAWLTNWTGQHQAEITSGSQSVQTDGIQDDGQGCVIQLNLDYRFDTAVTDAENTYVTEITAAIYVGTVGVADCNSALGSQPV